MKTIDVEGLPEPVAQALKAVVETLRDQLGGMNGQVRKVELPVWPGRPIGELRRRAIHEDRR